jgi:Holliday junction resolvase RusA-like endonuclease
MRYEVFVPGVVRPQGSLSLWRGNDGVERAKYSETTVKWRQTLHGALSRWWDGKPPLRVPVGVELTAYFGRPMGHLGTGRNAGTVRKSAPSVHSVYPDADKAARAVGDGLVDAGVIADDSLIAEWWIRKFWADPEQTPGAAIAIEEL